MNRPFFDLPSLLEDQAALFITALMIAIVLGAWLLVKALIFFKRLGEAKAKELTLRIRSWFIIVFFIIVPVMISPVVTILAVTILSLICFREYARATGLHRDRAVCALVILGILLLNFAGLDRWSNLHWALSALTGAGIAAAAILRDQPKGYIQRVGLGIFGFMFFGLALSYLSLIANDPYYRSLILFIILVTELNDVFAYVCGNLMGRRKLIPETSPNKTTEGALGAIVFTTLLTLALGPFVFSGTVLESWTYLIPLGVLISCVGQLGDLMLSSIKRDIGVKDLGVLIPGHGGFLDRFDSLILVVPAVFHFVNYFVGIAVDQPERIITLGVG